MVSVAIEAMNFRKPVCVGDVVSVYANIARVGWPLLRRLWRLPWWLLRRLLKPQLCHRTANADSIAASGEIDGSGGDMGCLADTR
jgi:hypothetical protein